MDWLHWVGNQYYSIPRFIREAKRLGVSRRVPRAVLKRMNWGDRIFLISRERGHKAPVVFGYFYLNRIEGIQVKWDEIPEHLRDKYTEVGIAESRLERRGCGFRKVGGVYITTSASIEELSEYMEVSENTQITGKLYLLPKPWPCLKPEGQPFKPFRGYRPFDGEIFQRDLEIWQMTEPEGTRPVLRSFYYVWN